MMSWVHNMLFMTVIINHVVPINSRCHAGVASTSSKSVRSFRSKHTDR